MLTYVRARNAGTCMYEQAYKGPHLPVTSRYEALWPVYVALQQQPVPIGKYKKLWAVKSKYLEKGELPCLPYWHCDIVRDGSGIDAVHYIWQNGCGSQTEFRDGTLLEPRVVYSYGATDEHRPTPAKWAGWRNLVRLTYWRKHELAV